MDLTVVFDRFFRRQLLWEQYSCALHEYRGECVLVAVQFLYNDVQTMRGKSQSTHIRTSSEAIVSGVKQDCPLSPTLFGVFVEPLNARVTGRLLCCGSSRWGLHPIRMLLGGSRLLSNQKHADDSALIVNLSFPGASPF